MITVSKNVEMIIVIAQETIAQFLFVNLQKI